MSFTLPTHALTQGSPPPFPLPTPCRSWCSHDGRFPTVHESARIALPIPVGLDVENGDLLSVRISVDDEAIDAPEVTLGHAGDNLSLSREQADEFADQLVAFAAQVRTLARIAYGTPQAVAA